MLGLNEAHPKSPEIERQAGRPENFRFLYNKVVFVGINRLAEPVKDRAATEMRVKAAAQWIDESLSRYPETHAAVLLANANAAGKMQKHFLPVLEQAARRFAKPILYVHSGSGEQRWFKKVGEWARNITRIQLGRVNADAPPVEMILFEFPDVPFQWDRRINDGRFFLPKPD